MNDETRCTMVDSVADAEQYVAGRMSDAARIAFEDHFVTCAACQREVALASAILLNVRAAPPAAATAPSRANLHATRWIAAGIVLAAGIAAIMITRATTSPALTSLGAVAEPPVYLGVAVRGTPGKADSAFEIAMRAYAARNYTAAAAGLAAALAAGEDSIPTEFFLGATQLLANDPRSAATTFARVVAKGNTGYRDEAQLYEAKALLRLGRGHDALQVLALHHSTDPAMASTLAALSDSVAHVLDR